MGVGAMPRGVRTAAPSPAYLRGGHHSAGEGARTVRPRACAEPVCQRSVERWLARRVRGVARVDLRTLSRPPGPRVGPTERTAGSLGAPRIPYETVENFRIDPYASLVLDHRSSRVPVFAKSVVAGCGRVDGWECDGWPESLPQARGCEEFCKPQRGAAHNGPQCGKGHRQSLL